MHIEFQVVSEIGPREEMEDCCSVVTCPEGMGIEYFFVVCDGHGGSHVANVVANQLSSLFRAILGESRGNRSVGSAFRKAFEIINERVSLREDGTCVVSAFISGDRLHFANVGDCELVIFRKRRFFTHSCIHRLENPREKRRVKKLGGKIDSRYLWLPEGDFGLEPLRTIGDRRFKPYGVIARPKCGSVLLKPGTVVILGTDGLFDCVTKKHINHFVNSVSSLGNLSESLRSLVLASHPKDNFTFVVCEVKS